MTKWWVLVLYFIVLCSSFNKGQKPNISDSAQNVIAWHESWCIIIIKLTFIVETMEQEVWKKSWRVKTWDNRNHQAGFLPKLMTMMMMTNGNGDPFKNTLTKQMFGVHWSQRVNFVPFMGCPFSPFPWEKSLETRFMQNEEKDWRLKRKMGAIGKVPSVCFSSAKKTVRKRFFGDRFYAVK